MSDCEVAQMEELMAQPMPNEPLLCPAEEKAWARFVKSHFSKGEKLEWTLFDSMSVFKAGIEYADDLAKQGA